MIKIQGTSHIAQESFESIEKAVEEEEPDLIAVELDENRLNSLLRGKKSMSYSLIPLLMQKLQKYLGKKTGIMPGEEMLKAVKVAEKNDIDLALIDQRIEKTVLKIKGIPLKEKLKLVFSLLIGFLLPYLGMGDQIDLKKVPDEDFIDRAMEEFKEEFPELYRILLEERNQIMAQNLIALDQKYSKVLAFVGAGHKKGIQDLIDNYY